MKVCVAPSCQAPAKTRSLCAKHYTRMRRYGELEPVGRITRAPKGSAVGPCAVEGCDTRATERGYCKLHGTRARRHGDPLVRLPQGPSRGPDHPGNRDDVTYVSIHQRLAKWRGRAVEHTCPCGAQARQWAYDHADPNEQVSPEGLPFSSSVDHYTAMCVPCHKSSDLARLGKAAS